LNQDYHPKRNQARQKLATLQINRFKELSGDVMNEIERRYPAVKTSGVNFASLDNLVADLGAMVQESTIFGSGEPKNPTIVNDIQSKPVEATIFSKPESIKSDNSLKRDIPRAQPQGMERRSSLVDKELLQLRDQVHNLSLRLREKDQEIINMLQVQQKVFVSDVAKIRI
jgi:hypothetical protein